jgi:hypothetical protein
MENVGIFDEHLVYFTAIGNVCGHLVYFVLIWYIFPRFGILYQENLANLLQKLFYNANWRPVENWRDI